MEIGIAYNEILDYTYFICVGELFRPDSLLRRVLVLIKLHVVSFRMINLFHGASNKILRTRGNAGSELRLVHLSAYLKNNSRST